MADGIKIKQEKQSEATSSTTTDVEQRVMELARSSAKGISDADIQRELPYITPQQKVVVINKLLSQGVLDVFSQGGSLWYRTKNASAGGSMKGADTEEKVVYGIIEEAGNKGIWIRDIRYKSNLIPLQLNKVLKALEGKKLIKAVKSVSASKKKVYMLYNLEPDRSVTGGAWYCDQDFEAEFVDVLNQQCYRFLQQKAGVTLDSKGGPLAARNMAYASSKDVWRFISELGISKTTAQSLSIAARSVGRLPHLIYFTVQLSVDDMETILDTLVYDGKVERSTAMDSTRLYRAIKSLLPSPGIVCMPCGVCPVLRSCSDIGSVTSHSCVYMKEWLE